MKFLAVLALLTLGGCASLQQFNYGGEAAFQVLHVVDVAQTMRGAASDPCFNEGDPVTRALIGAHPSHVATIAWGLGYGITHYAVYDWLTSHGHPNWAAAWEVASVIDTASVVNHNYQIGIRIGAPNHDDQACIDYYHGNIPTR
jgi:hypothetical protein